MPDLSGIFDKIGETARTIQQVKLAKDELAKKQTVFDLEQKQKNLEINKMRALGLADEGYIQSQEKGLKLQAQMQNNAFEIMNHQLEQQNNAAKTQLQTVGAYTTGMIGGAKSALAEQAQEQPIGQSSGQVGLMTAPQQQRPAGVMSYGGQDYKINPFDGKISEYKPEQTARGSASLITAKNKRTEELYATFENNKVNRDMIANAEDSLSRLQGGIVGKVKMDLMKNLDPNNPLLQDWQNVKMVLTDAQLLNTAKTKGAISDPEMELFAKAAANDDLTSIPRIIPVLNKLKEFLDAEEQMQVNTFKRLYGEDPMQWEELQNLRGGNQQQAQQEQPQGQQTQQTNTSDNMVGKYKRLQ